MMTRLQQANAALREQRYEEAIRLYVQLILDESGLAGLACAELELARRRYRIERRRAPRLRVAVCGWNLQGNAAGRVDTLARLFEPLAQVEMIGSLFPWWGREIWAPMRDSRLPIHHFVVDDERHFLEQALRLVLAHPYDLVYLSKPRMPNILMGALYKLIWGARVWVDMDDDELAFTQASQAVSVRGYLQAQGELPRLQGLAEAEWTRLSVGLLDAFDGVTVANPALQRRYGGLVIPHARDPRLFTPSAERRVRERARLGIGVHERVIIFLGTPRAHKGLLETARALAGLRRKDVLFLLVGTFPTSQQHLKASLKALKGLRLRFLDDQPFERIPDLLACADLCVLLQDPSAPEACMQTPAKLSDALAMGLRVLAEPTPGLLDLAEQGAFIQVDRATLGETLARVLDRPAPPPVAHPVFESLLSVDAVRPRLAALLDAWAPADRPFPADLSVLCSQPSMGPLAKLACRIASPPRAAGPGSRVRPIVLIAGEGLEKPGFVYRVERYAEAFRKAGESTHILARTDLEDARTLALIDRAKVIFIWRADWQSDIEQVIRRAKRSGASVVFDLDDLMVRPELAEARYIDAIRFERKDASQVKRHYDKVRATLMAADFATASTHELAWHLRTVPGRRPTFVLPNGYAVETYAQSRVHARRRAANTDGLVRIGYAGGTRTHQADFRLCVAALAEVLGRYPHCRLVLFRHGSSAMLDVAEYPELRGCIGQIEWRDLVAHALLPSEVGRFHINLAPLETGNPFCESKSELKFFEAALAEVPTIASPTGPFRRAIEHGVTGYLAACRDDWIAALTSLIEDPERRARMGAAAHRRSLWSWGPTRRVEIARSFLDQLRPGRAASRAAWFETSESQRSLAKIPLAEYRVLVERTQERPSRVTVIVPLFNYAHFVEEALESVRTQTLRELDLVVLDDHSSDESVSVVADWIERHHARFNRVLLAQHVVNQGLGVSRNTAIDLADTLYVMALDADNRLLPACCEVCSDALEREGAAFVYPLIEKFGKATGHMGHSPFMPANLIPGNFIDAMAMLSKEAWAAVGGYTHQRTGWEDYDLWCRFVERGLHAVGLPEALAQYRVHGNSMLRTYTDQRANKLNIRNRLEADHPWLSLLAESVSHHVPFATDQFGRIKGETPALSDE